MMSTLKTTYLQHPSSTSANITLASDGTVNNNGGQALAPAFRNIVDNGAFLVAQRGTSVTGITTSGYRTADRWYSSLNIGTWTQTVTADAPTGSGFRNCLKMLCTTANASPAAGGIISIEQAFEGQDLQKIAKGTASAQQLTLSFWVKSNVTGTYVLELYDGDNTRQVGATYTISSSGTWEKKTVTFPADTSGVLDNDANGSLQLTFFLGVGSNYSSGTLQTSWASAVTANRAVGQTNLAAATNNYWQVTGVQLEMGTVATSFEFQDFSSILRKCQRYYEKSYDVGTAPNTNTQAGLVQHSGSGNGSGRHYVPIFFQVEKRTNAYTVTTYPEAGGGNHWVTYNVNQAGLNRTPAILNKGNYGFTVDVEDGGYSWIVGNVRGHWTVSDDL